METLQLLANLHGSVDTAYRSELIERFDLDTGKRLRALSKGNRQKVQLVAALASRADLLLLDEPTSGLDPLMEMVFRQCLTEAKERGQAVFLSSHILAEVEATCDRIGILRSGRLVDEGTLQSLRHLTAHTLEVRFSGPAPALQQLDGVDVLVTGAGALRIEVQGALAPVVDALAGCGVTELASRQPSLEEIFLRHYDHGAVRAADHDHDPASTSAA
jgi:ABC-2 type transport system ATP-binding protein